MKGNTSFIKVFLKRSNHSPIRTKWNIVIACLLLSMTIFSCDSPVLTDTSILPTADGFQVGGEDTITVISTTIRRDSLPTDNTLLATFGQVNDFPAFGDLRSSVFMQFRLPTNNVDLGDSLVFDSVVLAIRYNGQYGDLATAVDFEVLELTEQLDLSFRYYNNSSVGTLSSNLARTPTQILSTQDSVFPVDGPYAAQIRVRLNDAWGENLMLQSGGSNFADNDAFRNFFPGLLLSSTHTNGDGFAYFNMISEDSRLTLYFSNSIGDSLSFGFPIGDLSAYFTQTEPTYTGSDIDQLFNSTSPEGDSVMMIQGLAGAMGYLQFPYLQNLTDVAINKAELIVTLDDSDTTFPFPISVLAVDKAAYDDPNIDLETDIYEGFLAFLNVYYFSAIPEEVTFGGQTKIQYNFNVSAYVQGIVNGSASNEGLLLFPFLDNFRAGRAIFYGGNHSQYPVSLNLTYTRIQ